MFPGARSAGRIRNESSTESKSAPYSIGRKQLTKAIAAFKGNGFLVLLDDRQITDLDEPLDITPWSKITFLRLVSADRRLKDALHLSRRGTCWPSFEAIFSGQGYHSPKQRDEILNAAMARLKGRPTRSCRRIRSHRGPLRNRPRGVLKPGSPHAFESWRGGICCAAN